MKAKSLSRVRLLVTPWTVAHQVPPSMGFSRQEYWSGVPGPSPILITKTGEMERYSLRGRVSVFQDEELWKLVAQQYDCN